MVHELVSLDVTNNPVLRALGEEVRRTGTKKLLRADGEALVLVSPARPVKRRTAKAPTPAAIEAALAAAGSWKGLVNPEEFKRQRRQLQVDDKPIRTL